MEEKTQKPIQLVQRQDIYSNYKLYIPVEVENKIRFACQKVWNTEWSGTLFFKPEGSFEDDNLVIKCVDIYIMDIGTQAYTEFDMNPDVISYMCEHPELLDCQMGLIHSHNNMSTFFSGTDTATLKEEGRDRNNFVSLIVNNAGTYTAAITRRLKNKTVKELVSYEFFGEGLREEELEYESTADIIEWFYLKIEKEKEDCSFSDMEARLEEIKKVKASKPSIPTTKPVPPSLTYSKDVPKTPKVSTTNNTTEYKDLFGIDYGHIQVNKELINSLVLQIVTGSILMSKESKLDIDKWVNSMPSMYEKRFGKGHEGFSLFQMWADVYTEFITWYIVDHRLENEGLDQTEIQSIYAFYIINELKKFPHNIYLKEYIEALEKYII